MSTIMNEKYEELFDSVESKARAFDEIAKLFYDRNFGTVSKSDVEVLMFSIYIEQILACGDTDFMKYSDYELAKDLGITQSRVSNLKVKKQLRYPHEFVWQESFKKVCKNARYENGKVIIPIPDINLYYEIKNAIEVGNGYVEVSLNKTLLVVPVEFFIDIMEMALADDDRKQLRKKVREEFQKHNKDKEFFDTEPLGKQIQGIGKKVVIELLGGIANSLCGQKSESLIFLAELIKNVIL